MTHDDLVDQFEGLSTPNAVRLAADLMDEAYGLAQVDPENSRVRLEVAQHVLGRVSKRLLAVVVDPVQVTALRLAVRR